jgi:hypothetical protein
MRVRPAHGTWVSCSEDRAIAAQMLVLANSMWGSGLRDPRSPGFVALTLPLGSVLHDSGSSMKHFATLIAGFAFSAATLHAQSSPNSVPESHRPPPGMCRIWIDGVPPNHQPAPTDCATAIRKRPLNARVVFGNDANGNERGPVVAQPRTSNLATPVAPSREEQDRAARLQEQRDEQERQRIAQERDAQERQRIEAQRQHQEQEKRIVAPPPPPPPPPPPRSQERVSPPRPRNDKPSRPPHSSLSTRRPG